MNRVAAAMLCFCGGLLMAMGVAGEPGGERALPKFWSDCLEGLVYARQNTVHDGSVDGEEPGMRAVFVPLEDKVKRRCQYLPMEQVFGCRNEVSPSCLLLQIAEINVCLMTERLRNCSECDVSKDAWSKLGKEIEVVENLMSSSVPERPTKSGGGSTSCRAWMKKMNIQYLSGVAKYWEGNYSEAKRVFDECAKNRERLVCCSDPMVSGEALGCSSEKGLPAFDMAVGYCEMKTGKYKDASDRFGRSEIQGIDVVVPLMRYWKAWSHAKQGDRETAVKMLDDGALCGGADEAVHWGVWNTLCRVSKIDKELLLVGRGNKRDIEKLERVRAARQLVCKADRTEGEGYQEKRERLLREALELDNRNCDAILAIANVYRNRNTEEYRKFVGEYERLCRK